MDPGSGNPLPDEKRARKKRQGRHYRLAAATSTVAKADVRSRELSKVSLMPPGLHKTLGDEEIIYLIASESMGDAKHPNFSN